ncbi:MAG: O-antigen ligase family protein [Aequorivita sp.]
MITYVIMIIIAWWLIGYYKLSVFKTFEDIIYILAILSLFFWVWQLFEPNSLDKLMTVLDLSGDGTLSKSIIIYTSHYQFVPGDIPRNAGFTWEPGPFASYLGLAIFFNLIRNGVVLKEKKRLLILLITVITTQSTTGFLLLLVILVWYVWVHYDNKLFRIFSIPVVMSVVILIFINVPELQEKILLESQQNIEDVIDTASVTGKSYNPGRFASFQLRLEDFKNYPIAGYGGNTSLQYGYIGEDNVVSAVNGLGTILGRYGAIGAIIFLILVMKSGIFLSKTFDYRGWFIFPALLLILGFSFGIIEAPILVVFWLLPVFLKIKTVNPKKLT